MTATTADTTIPNAAASQEESLLTPGAVQTLPGSVVTEAGIPEVEAQDEEGHEPDTEEPLSGTRTEDVDQDDDDEKESAPEPYDIEKCTLTFRVEIFPREADGAPRLALLAVNSHGDEPFKPRLVAFDGDFGALVSHMNSLYAELAAAMPERAAAAARRAAEEKARQEAEEAQRKARLARPQTKGKRKRGGSGQTNLLAVPGDGPTATALASTRIPAKPAPVSAANPEQPPVPAEPEKKEDQNQFSLFL